MRGRTMRSLFRQPEDVKRPSLFWRTTSVFVMLSQLLLCDSAMAQVSTPSIVAVASSPSGQACSANLPLKLKTPDGTLWSCQNGTYAQVGGSGSGGDAITSPAASLSVGGTSTATTLDLNLAHANSWTAAQTFSATNGIAMGAGLITFNGSSHFVFNHVVDTGSNGIVAGGVFINATQTPVAGSSSGTVTFSQTNSGVAYKKIVIYVAALSGTASFSFPSAFSHVPMIIVDSNSGGVPASMITSGGSLSATAVTLSGGGTVSGYLMLEGF